ncbi:hypothetical protein M0802_012243 [Mischocyttarus mexicanus]|nr:hypothetical protein M0802_012243 [Mischocyttarus mexicanus]
MEKLSPAEFSRFLSGKHHNSTCFKSFSYGRRNCIGQKLAMYMMKVIIAAVLRKFIVKMDNPKNIEDIGLVFGITTTTTETVLLRFINR